MKTKNLLIATGLVALIALTGCEAKKPLTEAVAESVVAATPATPVVTPETASIPAPLATATEHCDKNHAPAHDCVVHCAENKGVKDAVCQAHCDNKAVADHDCTKHCAETGNVKDKICVEHCDKGAATAAGHICDTHHVKAHKKASKKAVKK